MLIDYIESNDVVYDPHKGDEEGHRWYKSPMAVEKDLAEQDI